jgi:trans-2,3-dihydro-3-hydroxyanthranilate isomerase
MTDYAIHWVDVFTDRPFAGNQLAVLPEADGLSDEQMQTIAAELNLSETTFVRGAASELRIFTPRVELPLAGHPVVGAALVLAWTGAIPDSGEYVFLTGVGETLVDIRGDVATVTLAAFDPGTELDPELMASLLRIAPDEVVGTPRACSAIDTPQALVQVRDAATLAGIQPDLRAIAEFKEAMGVGPWCEDGHELAQRLFAPADGIDEDPATGSMAGALGALRVFEGGEPGSVIVRQGAEIGRPSEMRVTVAGSPGSPSAPQVGGTAVRLLQGTISV